MLSPKNLLALLPLLLLTLTACGPKAGESKSLDEKWPNGNRRCTGTLVWHEGQWVKDGSASFFEEDGSARATGNYVLGLESGAWIEHLAGGITGTGNYQEGQRHGPWTYSYESGQVQESGSYERGLRQGEWRGFHPDGKLRTRATWSAGALQGPRADYRSDGSLIAETSGTYKDGVKISD